MQLLLLLPLRLWLWLALRYWLSPFVVCICCLFASLFLLACCFCNSLQFFCRFAASLIWLATTPWFVFACVCVCVGLCASAFHWNFIAFRCTGIVACAPPLPPPTPACCYQPRCFDCNFSHFHATLLACLHCCCFCLCCWCCYCIYCVLLSSLLLLFLCMLQLLATLARSSATALELLGAAGLPA